MSDTPPLKLFWQRGDRRLALRLFEGRPVIWVDSPEQADLVLGQPSAVPTSPALTPREAEILDYLADGWSNAEIANRLALTSRTIKFHLAGLFVKLGVTRRTEAIREAHRLGLIRY